MGALYFISWLLAAICFYYLVIFLKNRYRVIVNVQKLHGPPKYNIIVGNVKPLHSTQDIIFKYGRKWAKEYYPIYKVWFFFDSLVNILSPEDCELILSNQKHITKGPMYTLLHQWMGTGLLTSTGKKWQLRRRILTPTFHFSILRKFVSTFNEQAENLVVSLKDHCEAPFVEIDDHISEFTLKTIGETAMGTKFTFSSSKETDFRNTIYKVGAIMVYKLMRPWMYYGFLKISKYFYPIHYRELKLTSLLHNFTKEIIVERQKNFQWDSSELLDENVKETAEEDEVYAKKDRLAMLDLMISAKNKEGLIDDDGIREEVDTFMFEGHDTTTVALNFAIMLLANNKSCQDLIVAEMLEVLGDISKKPSYNDLQNLKYMEWCIKETLRLYPSVHYISRELGEDMITGRGELLPKGCVVQIHIYDVHHNADIYPDPEKFDPQRFSPENCQKRHPFAYIPFSAGPRNCIGQKFALLELKAALCGILSRFVLEPVDTPETIVPFVDLVLRTKDPIKVKLRPRQI